MPQAVTLRRAQPREAGLLHRMQQAAFAPLLEKYQDYHTSPACESVERIFQKLTDPNSFYYLILLGEHPIGGIRIVEEQGLKRIAPLFVLPQHQHRGYATVAVRLAEQLHGSTHWQLDTILQEEALCRFYERLGYHQTGKVEQVSPVLSLVYYEK